MSRELFHILLVEDNAADVYLFRKALEEADVNFELTVIADGAEALEFVRREAKFAERPIPHLALVDLNLPKHDGIELLEAIRQNQDFSDVAVVVISSSASPRERAQVERHRIERFIRKPPALEDFLKIGQIVKEILLKNKSAESSAATP